MPASQATTPELFTLQKMQPHEITDTQSRLYSDGHFFPLSIMGVPASDYGTPIYRLTEIVPANGINNAPSQANNEGAAA